MNSKQREFVQELDMLTTLWKYQRSLFSGGCAYATAIIARELEKMGIEYEVITYDDSDFDVIKNGSSCGHMGIQVKVNTRYEIIGGDFQFIFKKWMTKKNLGMVPYKDILKYYRTLKSEDGWNHEYNTNYNPYFSRECGRICRKYCGHDTAEL